MNEVVPFHGVNLVTAGRFDVAGMMRHYLAPYAAAEPFEDLIQTVKLNSTPDRRSNNQRPSAAIAINRAVAGVIASPAQDLPPAGPYMAGRSALRARDTLTALRDLIQEAINDIDLYEKPKD